MVRGDQARRSMHGTISWFNNEKAYGFIEPGDGGGDFFVRLDPMQMGELGPFRRGDPVTFDVVEGPKGPLATNLVRGLAPGREGG